MTRRRPRHSINASWLMVPPESTEARPSGVSLRVPAPPDARPATGPRRVIPPPRPNPPSRPQQPRPFATGGTARGWRPAGRLSGAARTGDTAWRAAPPGPHRQPAHHTAAPPRAAHHRVRATRPPAPAVRSRGPGGGRDRTPPAGAPQVASRSKQVRARPRSWHTRRRGRPTRPTTGTRGRTACQAAGVPTRFLHGCRRTAARTLIRTSVPERVAMLLTCAGPTGRASVGAEARG